jgi:beta-barrel assembly-enhancing protease
MKYQPSLPEHNDNVTHEHPAKEFFILLAGLLGVSLVAFVCLGMLIDVAVDRMSDDTEASLNAASAFKVEKKPSYSPPQQANLQALADELKQCAGVRYPVTVHLVKNEQANAAVLPGANMMVFSGLLEQVQSTNGLSFVLAHELAHLKQRDHWRAMGRSVVLLAMSAALTGSNSGMTELLMPVQQLGTATYSRERESMADSAALAILHCRYGHVGGATEFFEALKGTEADRGSGISHYLASHPGMQARIDQLQRTISEKNMKTGPVLPFEKVPPTRNAAQTP